MAGPRKPTAQLELVGAFKKNPQRKREHEPQCDEAAILPPYPLDEHDQICWDFLIETAVPGVLTKMDSAYLALCAHELAKCWFTGKGNSQKAGAMLVRLGMTPTERSRVIVAKKEKASRVSGLARKA